MTARSTAAELAAAVVAAVPKRKRSLFSVMEQQRVPMLSDRDSENESCPKCGRRLPFTFAENSGGGLQGTIVITHGRAEYVAACLVDGRRACHARDFSAAEILDAARVIQDGLRDASWRSWTRLFGRALQGWLADEQDRVESVGQALEALRSHGPIGEHWLSSDVPSRAVMRATREASEALEILVASSGRLWRSRTTAAA